MSDPRTGPQNAVAREGERREALRALASTCGLLARIFASEADADLLDAIRVSGTAAWLADHGEPLDARLLQGDAKAVCEELAVEYARLFLGPGPHLSPHESVWLGKGGEQGLHWGEETAAVQRFVRALGMDYRSDFPHLPDHVSVELELVASLAAEEEVALGKGANGEADRFREIRLRFLREHLSRWVGRFAEEVCGAGRITFYGPFARFAAALVASELDTGPVESDTGR